MTRRRRRLIAGLVALAVVLAACGGSDDDETGDAQSTTTAPSSTTTEPEPAETEKVEADAFQVPFTIDKPADWSTPPLGPAHLYFVLAPPQNAPDYTTALEFSIPAAATMEAVTEEITGSADYTVGEPTEVTVAGKSAMRFDVQIDPTNLAPPPLFSLAEGGSWALFAGNQGRIYIIDVDGKLVTAMIEAPIESFEDFARGAEAVLDTTAF